MSVLRTNKLPLHFSFISSPSSSPPYHPTSLAPTLTRSSYPLIRYTYLKAPIGIGEVEVEVEVEVVV